MIINTNNPPFHKSIYSDKEWAMVAYSYGIWPDSLSDEAIKVFMLLNLTLSDKRDMRVEHKKNINDLKDSSQCDLSIQTRISFIMFIITVFSVFYALLS